MTISGLKGRRSKRELEARSKELMGLLLGEEDEKRKEYLFTGTRFPIVQHCCQQVWEDVESMDDDMNDNLMMSRGK